MIIFFVESWNFYIIIFIFKYLPPNLKYSEPHTQTWLTCVVYIIVQTLIRHIRYTVHMSSRFWSESQPTNQPTNHRTNWGRRLAWRRSRRSSVRSAIPAFTALLSSETDTLNYNWNCTYAQEFVLLRVTMSYLYNNRLANRVNVACHIISRPWSQRVLGSSIGI